MQTGGTVIIFTVLLLVIGIVTAKEYKKSEKKISSCPCKKNIDTGIKKHSKSNSNLQNPFYKNVDAGYSSKVPSDHTQEVGRKHRRKGYHKRRPLTKRPLRGGGRPGGRGRGGAKPTVFSINSGLPLPEPLFLRPGGSPDVTGFVVPRAGDVVRLRPGERVVLACPGGPHTPNLLGSTSRGEVLATAAGASNLRLEDGSLRSLASLACKHYPSHVARNTGRKCGRPQAKYPIIEVGFLTPNKSIFYKLYEVCFDDITFNTYYSLNILIPEIIGHKLNLQRPLFLQGAFYNGLKLKDLYSRNEQTETIGKILNSKDLAATYIKPYSSRCKSYYLVPGQLAPNLDFIYPSHQRATFWYLNSAPQFQTFKLGNWAALEESVRKFSITRKKQLLVYTGTHGVTTLSDADGIQRPIYLSENGPKSKLRVPQHFWKVVIDPYTNRGVAFVGINNPYYIESYSCNFKLCENICDKISWINWQADNLTAGFSYCCDVNDLSVYVNEIPDLHVVGLLT